MIASVVQARVEAVTEAYGRQSTSGHEARWSSRTKAVAGGKCSGDGLRCFVRQDQRQDCRESGPVDLVP